MKEFRLNLGVKEREELNSKRKLQRNMLSLKQTFKKKMRLNRKERERKSYNSELKRLRKFLAATRYGPIFVCSSCDQKMFENWVCELDNSLTENLRAKNSAVYEKVFKYGFTNITIYKCENGTMNSQPTKAYLCITCKKHLKNGKVPPMSVANSLKLGNVDPNLQLTELENNLIAKDISTTPFKNGCMQRQTSEHSN